MLDLSEFELLQIERVLSGDIKKRSRQRDKKPKFVPEPGKRDAEEVKIELMQSALQKVRDHRKGKSKQYPCCRCVCGHPRIEHGSMSERCTVDDCKCSEYIRAAE